MKRVAQALLLALLTQRAFASGMLNILLAGSIAILSSSASPTSLTYSYPSATLTSASTTCTGKGGIPPYTYGWSWASGGASIGIDSATSATTAFTVSAAAVNTTYSGVAQCQVTDARPVPSPYSNGVSVSLTRIPLLPPSEGTATLVAGSSAPDVGYSSGLGIGSLSPSTDYNGFAVTAILCVTSDDVLTLVVTQPSSNSGYVTTLSLNGTLLATSSATYTYSSPHGTWSWSSTPCPFTSGDSYPVLYY